MCICTLKKKLFLKKLKIPQRGCVTPPNVPKLCVSGVKDTTKINKDLGISCYIQAGYGVFIRW